jgi:putative ABC transport system ATP-binding protein/lipoprotein-releasing system ATP-binding protein
VLENLIVPVVFSIVSLEAYRRAFNLLKTIGLAEKHNAYPYQLSAGQQRRVAIARALINKPEIILADEPTGDLDEDTEIEVMEFLKQINAEGATILLVTHNPGLSVYGNRHFKMAHGKLTEL